MLPTQNVLLLSPCKTRVKDFASSHQSLFNALNTKCFTLIPSQDKGERFCILVLNKSNVITTNVLPLSRRKTKVKDFVSLHSSLFNTLTTKCFTLVPLQDKSERFCVLGLSLFNQINVLPLSPYKTRVKDLSTPGAERYTLPTTIHILLDVYYLL